MLLMEKSEIVTSIGDNLLSKKKELISKCRNLNQYYISNYVPKDWRQMCCKKQFYYNIQCVNHIGISIKPIQIVLVYPVVWRYMHTYIYTHIYIYICMYTQI